MVVWPSDDVDSNPEYQEIPSEYSKKAKELRHDLLESVSEFNEELLQAYLSDSEIKEEQVKLAIRAGTIQRKIFPTFCGSALKNKSVQLVLDAVSDYLPSPLDIGGISGSE